MSNKYGTPPFMNCIFSTYVLIFSIIATFVSCATKASPYISRFITYIQYNKKYEKYLKSIKDFAKIITTKYVIILW
ncbi:hypothetical protein GJ496_000016 [Pomphorhynchus laevis]|nr:hypothetical protein GJ496_000016 [Pomphorhynchus laevis]